jgi:hypothetical protein
MIRKQTMMHLKKVPYDSDEEVVRSPGIKAETPIKNMNQNLPA